MVKEAKETPIPSCGRRIRQAEQAYFHSWRGSYQNFGFPRGTYKVSRFISHYWFTEDAAADYTCGNGGVYCHECGVRGGVEW